MNNKHEGADDVNTKYSRPAAAALYQQGADNTVRCLACAHRCHIAPGHTGICRARSNWSGTLHAPYGYVAGLQVDPIEKKPFYHVLPGSNALSFGMLGCNFHCAFCQNWRSSQIEKELDASGARSFTPAEMVALAEKYDAPTIVSTYNEPLITADWAAPIFEQAKLRGRLCGFVSNGYATPEVLDFLLPVMDLFKVDLKCFTDAGYRSLGARLQPVLDAITRVAASGLWIEVVTLVVPGFNDSAAELNGMARFLAGVSPDIPWHVTAFYPTYKMTDRPATSASMLYRAYDAGKNAGLRYVYAGNMGGHVEDREHTLCHQCKALLIERMGCHIVRNRLREGRCPDCGASIPGRWTR